MVSNQIIETKTFTSKMLPIISALILYIYLYVTETGYDTLYIQITTNRELREVSESEIQLNILLC